MSVRNRVMMHRQGISSSGRSRAFAVCVSLWGAGVFGVDPTECRAQEKPPAVAQASTTLVELKPARLMFVDRHEVAFDRPGVLQMVLEEGETVQQGQVIAKLEDVIAKAAVEVAQARVVNRAEIEASKKQAELARVKYQAAQAAQDGNRESEQAKTADPALAPTVRRGLYPQVYLDELRLSFEAARAEIGRFEKEHEVNQKGLSQAQAELSVLELKAPRAGLVTRAFKQTGEGIQSGEKVLEIISIQRVRVEVEVPAVTAARLRVGMPVTVIVHQPSGENSMDVERYPSTLKFIDPTIGQVSQKVRVWTELVNTEGKLREGLTASIEIVPNASAKLKQPE